MNEALEMMAVFSGPLNSMMVRARERCFDISGSERLLGYEDSAKDYRTMGEEFSGLALWVNAETNRMKNLGLIPANEDYIPDCLSG